LPRLEIQIGVGRPRRTLNWTRRRVGRGSAAGAGRLVRWAAVGGRGSLMQGRMAFVEVDGAGSLGSAAK
jgi:hypothetical protein